VTCSRGSRRKKVPANGHRITATWVDELPDDFEDNKRHRSTSDRHPHPAGTSYIHTSRTGTACHGGLKSLKAIEIRDVRGHSVLAYCGRMRCEPDVYCEWQEGLCRRHCSRLEALTIREYRYHTWLQQQWALYGNRYWRCNSGTQARCVPVELT